MPIDCPKCLHDIHEPGHCHECGWTAPAAEPGPRSAPIHWVSFLLGAACASVAAVAWYFLAIEPQIVELRQDVEDFRSDANSDIIGSLIRNGVTIEKASE